MILQFKLSYCKYSIHLAEILAIFLFTCSKNSILLAKILVEFLLFTVSQLDILLVDVEVEKERKNEVGLLFDT